MSKPKAARKIEVSRISLQLGEKKNIELSLGEARELQQILADLLGLETERKCNCNRITVIPASPVVTVPYPYPIRPKRYWEWEVHPFEVGAFPNTGTIAITSVGNESSSGVVSNIGNTTSKQPKVETHKISRQPETSIVWTRR